MPLTVVRGEVDGAVALLKVIVPAVAVKPLASVVLFQLVPLTVNDEAVLTLAGEEIRIL